MRRPVTKNRDRQVLAIVIASDEDGRTKNEISAALDLAPTLVYESLWQLRVDDMVYMDTYDQRWHSTY